MMQKVQVCADGFKKNCGNQLNLLFLRPIFFLLIFLASCTTPVAPALTATPPLTSTLTSLPTITPTTQPPAPVPIPARPIYHLTTTFDYDRHFLTVDEVHSLSKPY